MVTQNIQWAHAHKPAQSWDVSHSIPVSCICCGIVGQTEWDILRDIMQCVQQHVCGKQRTWLMALLPRAAREPSSTADNRHVRWETHMLLSSLAHTWHDKYRLSGNDLCLSSQTMTMTEPEERAWHFSSYSQVSLHSRCHFTTTQQQIWVVSATGSWQG